MILPPTPKVLVVCLGSRPLPWRSSLPDGSLALGIQTSASHSGPQPGHHCPLPFVRQGLAALLAVWPAGVFPLLTAGGEVRRGRKSLPFLGPRTNQQVSRAAGDQMRSWQHPSITWSFQQVFTGVGSQVGTRSQVLLPFQDACPTPTVTPCPSLL